MDIEEQARLLGWKPKEEYSGASEWVDAEVFVDKGRNILPILQDNNKRLLGEVSSLKTTISGFQAALNEAKESMEAMKGFHEESTKAQVAKARSEIIEKLKEAKENGNVDAEIEMTSSLSKFDAAAQEVKSSPVTVKKEETQAALDPIVEAWMKDNKWYGSDEERSGLMDGVARKLRREQPDLKGREFLEEAARIVDERLEGASNRTSKTEGSRGGSSEGSGGNKGFNGLPADAKEACKKQAAKFVGDNRMFKTTAEWNSYYADQYYKGA